MTRVIEVGPGVLVCDQTIVIPSGATVRGGVSGATSPATSREIQSQLSDEGRLPAPVDSSGTL